MKKIVIFIKSWILRTLRAGLREKIFSNSKEYRSASDNGRYGAAVSNALKNQNAFKNFKRNYSYREILEHVSKEQGLEYLKILQKRNDGLLNKAKKTVLVKDYVGNPIKFNYPDFSLQLSPTTLRYVKVASDLRILFGENLGNVAEIGCGYGGQALINDQLLNVSKAKLFDLPFVNKLINRYLNTQLFNGSFITTTINEEINSKYDLVISNYAFSELPKKLQILYIKKVISQSERGYLTMNTGLFKNNSDSKLSIDDLRNMLPKFEIFEEEPLTSSQNYLIVWGNDNLKILDYFKLKK